MFWRKKPSEEDLLEQEYEYQISDRAMQIDSVLQQIRREFPETYIFKDEVIDNILFHMAFKSKRDKDGNIVFKKIKNHSMVGLYFIHSTISQLSWLDRYHAEYLIALVRKELYKEKLRVKLDPNLDPLEKSRIYSLLNFLEAYYIKIIASEVDGRRVSALKVQPHIVKAEIRRRKGGKEERGGFW
ncbi:MAG: hypothetical protein QW175_01685 [Candidatus Bathyarchaeia archaeon]